MTDLNSGLNNNNNFIFKPPFYTLKVVLQLEIAYNTAREKNKSQLRVTTMPQESIW